MEDLIKALQIFLKYSNDTYPTCCEHDELHVCVDPNKVSEEDMLKLDELGFTPDGVGGFHSFRFGSC